jgi:chloride channel 7
MIYLHLLLSVPYNSSYPSTRSCQIGLPLMATLITARFIGNIFNEGIYDLHIDLRGWPVLPQRLDKHLAQQLRVQDVMIKPPVVFEEIMRAGDVLRILQSNEHNGFPVVFSASVMRAYPRIGSLAGLIERKHLAVLLIKKAFHAGAVAL